MATARVQSSAKIRPMLEYVVINCIVAIKEEEHKALHFKTCTPPRIDAPNSKYCLLDH